MKQRYLAVLMGIFITMSSINVFAAEIAESTVEEAAEEDSVDETEVDDEDEILGEVESVSEDSITIAIGTRKEMGRGGPGTEDGVGALQKPGNGDGEEPDKPSGESEGGRASFLELTGEEMMITVTEDTKIFKISLGKSDNKDRTQDTDGGHEASEEISFSDISEEDVIAVTLDEDGNALTITVQSVRGGFGDRGMSDDSNGQAGIAYGNNSADGQTGDKNV